MTQIVCPNDNTYLGEAEDNWDAKRCPTCNCLIFREQVDGMKVVECEYIDNDGYCHHPDLCCIQECGIILNNDCKLIR